MVQDRDALPRRLASLVLGVSCLAVVGCSSSSSGGPAPSPSPSKSVQSLRDVAVEFAHRDRARGPAPYVAVVDRLATRCHISTPIKLQSMIAADYNRLTSHGPNPGSVLSVMRILAGRATPNGPPGQCQQDVSALLREVTGSAGSGSSYAGFGGTVSSFAAAHRADPARAGGYLPRLPDGRDSYVVAGDGRVTSVIRSFDPPITQSYALAVIRRQLLPPGRDTSVYGLDAHNCSETIYVNPTLGSLFGSKTAGVMVELTSGHGASSRYNASAVNRARLVAGSAIGGQPCL